MKAQRIRGSSRLAMKTLRGRADIDSRMSRIKDDTSQRSVHSLTTSITMALCLDRISHPRFDRAVNKLIELTHQVDVGRLC